MKAMATLSGSLAACALSDPAEPTRLPSDDDVASARETPPSAVGCDALPLEVLERVLEELDGPTLARARRVCWKWKQLVDHLEDRGIWRTRCVRDVHPDTLHELLPYAAVGRPVASEAWKDAYVRWHRLGRLGEAGLRCGATAVPVADHAPVSCILAKGSNLISGHRNGEIHMWDAASGEHVLRVEEHRGMVLHLVAWNEGSDDRVWFVASSSKANVVIVHRFGPDGGLQGATQLLHGCNGIKELVVYDNMLAACAENNTVMVWCLQEAKDNPAADVFVEAVGHEGPPGGLWAMGYWNYSFTCVGHDGAIWTLREGANWTATSLRLHRADKPHASSPLSQLVMKCFVFRGSIFMFVTVNHHLLVSVDGTRHFALPTLAKLHSGIVTISLAGDLLAIGTERGAVYVYHFRRPEDLVDLDLAAPMWKAKISGGSSIISISISMELRQGPILACASADAIYILRWEGPHATMRELDGRESDARTAFGEGKIANGSSDPFT